MMPSSIPMIRSSFYLFYLLSAKNGVIQARVNPRPLRIIHKTAIRLSHVRDLPTVLRDLEKFIRSRAADAVTMVATIEVLSILP